MKSSLSNHARMRFRQRGISEEGVEYLKKYGNPDYAIGSAVRLSLSRRDANRIIERLKRDIRWLERAGRIVLIEKEGKILTGYHKV